MPSLRISTAALVGVLASLATAPTAFAGTELLPSNMQLLGRTMGFSNTVGTGDTDLHLVQTSTPPGQDFPYIDSQPLAGNGFYSESTYAFTQSATQTNFLIDFPRLDGSLKLYSGYAGNLAETRGSIFFTISEDTSYALTGDLTITSNTSLDSQIYGAIYQVIGSNGQQVTYVSQPGGPLPPALGTLFADPNAPDGKTTFEFRYDVYIQATLDQTVASASGFVNLSLGSGTSEPPSETPLPTVATAGVALFGALSLRRPRR